MTLELAHSRNDLPISWDGEPVEWTGWSAGRTTLLYHLPADALACRQFGPRPLKAKGRNPAFSA